MVTGLAWVLLQIGTSMPCVAQDTEPREPATAPADVQLGLDPSLLRWPHDKDLVVGRTDVAEVTLEQVLRHVERRHAPGLLVHLETQDGQRELNSPAVPMWVRQYCDLRLLQDEANRLAIAPERVPEVIERILGERFQTYKRQYLQQRAQQGHPAEWTPSLEEFLLRRFRKAEGLEAEIHAHLELLVPDEATPTTLRNYHADHGDYFGGKVMIAHILVRHRDLLTGRLFDPASQAKIADRLRDIKSRLREDGVNFAAVAQTHSDDEASNRRGGELGWIDRLDPRLPAALVRAAWALRDGQWTGPVESAEGYHFVRRNSFTQQTHVLFNGDAIQRVRGHLRAVQQEALIFELRNRRKLELKI
jgi:hypothetical protein